MLCASFFLKIRQRLMFLIIGTLCFFSCAVFAGLPGDGLPEIENKPVLIAAARKNILRLHAKRSSFLEPHLQLRKKCDDAKAALQKLEETAAEVLNGIEALPQALMEQLREAGSEVESLTAAQDALDDQILAALTEYVYAKLDYENLAGPEACQEIERELELQADRERALAE